MNLIEISQLHATPDGTYINGAVEGWLAQYVAGRTEKQPAKAKLQEGAQTIDVTLWGGNLGHWQGKRVRFSGKGMKVTEYKGVKQLSVGDKVVVEGASQDHPPARSPQTANPTAFTGPKSFAAAHSIPPKGPSPQEPLNPPINLPHPATVGMCVKLAGDIWLKTYAGSPWEKESALIVSNIAKDLIAVCQDLEKGQQDHF